MKKILFCLISLFLAQGTTDLYAKKNQAASQTKDEETTDDSEKKSSTNTGGKVLGALLGGVLGALANEDEEDDKPKIRPVKRAPQPTTVQQQPNMNMQNQIQMQMPMMTSPAPDITAPKIEEQKKVEEKKAEGWKISPDLTLQTPANLLKDPTIGGINLQGATEEYKPGTPNGNNAQPREQWIGTIRDQTYDSNNSDTLTERTLGNNAQGQEGQPRPLGSQPPIARGQNPHGLAGGQRAAGMLPPAEETPAEIIPSKTPVSQPAAQ